MVKNLEKIASDIKAGNPVQPVTVRELLSWFGAQRRGWYIVYSIRNALRRHSLVTRPDFESAYIDSRVSFALVAPSGTKAKSTKTVASPKEIEIAPSVTPTQAVTQDPTYRISKLAAANQKVVSVKPDSTLAEVVTVLMEHDFSQAPVMTTDREVKGMISWKSIGERLGLGVKVEAAGDAMDSYQEVASSISMFDAIPMIISNDYVLVRGEDKTIVGIVTASDLSVQFRSLSEPFLLLSEIENILRMMIEARFNTEDIKQACNPADKDREVNSVADLAFGEYIRLLENEERWKKFKVPIHRVRFCERLDNVRIIRNDVMHFDPDGISSEDLEVLRDFVRFMKRLSSLMLPTAQPS